MTTKPKPALRAAIYARTSVDDTDAQRERKRKSSRIGADLGETDSIEQQVKLGLERCQSQGFQVDEKASVYRDVNYSGRTYPTGAKWMRDDDSSFLNYFNAPSRRLNKKYRPGLGALLKRIKTARDIDVIVALNKTLLKILSFSMPER